MMRYIWPFVIFMALAGFLYVGLGLNPHEVPSPLINKPAPAFTLPQLHDPAKKFSSEDMKGKVWLFNVWASWCVSCREEHPLLMALARQNIVPIYGLDYKDRNEDGEAWLRNGGDPYTLVITDADGRVGIDYGVYGVPETYVIDKQGVIRYKQIGAVTHESLQEKILPLIAELQAK
ncbi:MAG TPA: DsbE family thiol:disulfide interchange protein [Gallionella sp.]|nr:DsbE family thiol:disulfide interchange protein [Gallionella sp.]